MSKVDVENRHILESSSSSNNHHAGSTISFHSINYRIKTGNLCSRNKEKEILFNLRGIFKSGMNAILGPTGCGKSSLLDILADRKDRRGLEGQVFIDGEIQESDFKYRVGYVVQDDIVSGNLTVRENLMFSANLRLTNNVSSKQREVIADEVIEQLGLQKCANSKVGTEFQRGVSGGERKRTNIGMELVLSPRILFLDEPTTGLDSSTARNVMEYLHKLSRKDRTIIFSIHQPRYSIFKLFDTIYLLSSGRCMYHGPSKNVLQHFSSIGFTCEEHDNPADFLLDVCQGDYQIDIPNNNSTSNTIDFTNEQERLVHYLNTEYEKTPVYTQISEEINATRGMPDNAARASANSKSIGNKSRLKEIYYVSQRTLRNAFRNPALIGMQTGVSIFLGILLGLIYLNTDRTVENGVPNRSGAMFFIATNQVFSSLSALDLFIKERPLFQHENISGYYHVSTYFMAKLICDILPLRTIPAILFSVSAYFLIGFQRTVIKYFIFLLGIFCTTISASSLCFFVSASVRVYGIANLVAAMFCVLTLVFSGFLVNVGSVVSFLSWIRWISIFRYSSNIFAINEFVGVDFCPSTETTNCTISGTDILNDILKKQHLTYESNWTLWQNFVALAGITLGFLILTYIQLLRMKKTK